MNDWAEKVKAAHDMVSALCRTRGSKGSREWIMSIPARPDYDPDLVITSGLMAAEKHIKSLNAQIAACAAGPWRYDVENAPKDGTNLLIAWRWLGNIQIDRLFWCGSYGFWTDGSGIRCCIMHDTVVAFAVPSPPQVKP